MTFSCKENSFMVIGVEVVTATVMDMATANSACGVIKLWFIKQFIIAEYNIKIFSGFVVKYL